MGIKENDKTYVANTYARFPVELVSGSGSLVYDANGKEYIDLNSGIAVNSFGVADKEWQAAVTAQLGKIQHTSNLYYSEPCSTLAKMLCEKTGMKKVFFSNSGAEANEAAVKVARKYAAEKKGQEYFTVVTLKNSFHGRTLAMLAATGQDGMHADFLPLMPGFVYADPDDPSSLEKCVMENKVAAIMFEIVRGEGGVLPLEKSFVEKIDKVAKENDILIICDEVQTGNGRTGALYAYMNYGITPDIVTTAKGLGGGLPIGATLLGEKVKDTLTPGSHGSTFGGNPVSCAGACSILSRIDGKLLDEVKQKSKYVFDALDGAKGIKSVTGMGLMIGIETEKPAADVINGCIEKGVLPIKAKEKVRLLPALNIPFELLKKGIEVIKEVAAK
ncbi:MAG: acetylornithine/succinylornithine family transaminase [Clostridia bacterium]|nr:acetylornithine/succinylornithine family transaminase [Clostridia bacterium]MBO4428580.1 acetylornithine/succinylornithine family transaminase [Clostridia bacterium]